MFNMSRKGVPLSRRRPLFHIGRLRLPWGLVCPVGLSLLAGAVVPSSHLAVLSRLPASFGPFGIHTWLHFLGYAALGAVLMGASWYMRLDRGFAVPLVASAGYGLSVEIFHAAVPYRTFSFLDVWANVLGAFVGVLVVWLAFRTVVARLRAVRTPLF